MTDSPFRTWNHFFDVEWRVNGIWNTILSRKYTPTTYANGGYIISPEAYPKPADTKGLRADLMVAKIQGPETNGSWTISQPLFVYEGKGGNVKDSWDSVGDQLAKWCGEAAKVKKFNCWAAAAIGSEVRFHCFKEDAFIDVHFDGVEFRQNAETLDLMTAAGYGRVMAALAYAVAYPA
jgi:hypothetical protein